MYYTADKFFLLVPEGEPCFGYEVKKLLTKLADTNANALALVSPAFELCNAQFLAVENEIMPCIDKAGLAPFFGDDPTLYAPDLPGVLETMSDTVAKANARFSKAIRLAFDAWNFEVQKAFPLDPTWIYRCEPALEYLTRQRWLSILATTKVSGIDVMREHFQMVEAIVKVDDWEEMWKYRQLVELMDRSDTLPDNDWVKGLAKVVAFCHQTEPDNPQIVWHQCQRRMSDTGLRLLGAQVAAKSDRAAKLFLSQTLL